MSQLSGSVEVIFQSLTWAELRHLGCFDFDRCACAWVAACACSTFANGKSTETNQGHGATFFERLFDGINHGVECACRCSFRDV